MLHKLPHASSLVLVHLWRCYRDILHGLFHAFFSIPFHEKAHISEFWYSLLYTVDHTHQVFVQVALGHADMGNIRGVYHEVRLMG